MESFFNILPSSANIYIYAPTILPSSLEYYDCPQCGMLQLPRLKENPVKMIAQGKGKYPDFMLCGHHPYTLLSQKAVNILESEANAQMDLLPVELYDPKGNSRAEEHDGYYIMRPKTVLEMDYQRMGLEVVSDCPECGVMKFDKQPKDFGKLILDYPEDKPLPDLFRLKHNKYMIFCTKKLLEIIYRNSLKNINASMGRDAYIYGVEDLNLKEMFKKPRKKKE